MLLPRSNAFMTNATHLNITSHYNTLMCQPINAVLKRLSQVINQEAHSSSIWPPDQTLGAYRWQDRIKARQKLKIGGWQICHYRPAIYTTSIGNYSINCLATAVQNSHKPAPHAASVTWSTSLVRAGRLLEVSLVLQKPTKAYCFSTWV